MADSVINLTIDNCDLSYNYRQHLLSNREREDESDWMSKYFFTGGIMPSNDLLLHFDEHFTNEKKWVVNGNHYSKTSEAWLKKMDVHKKEIMPLFETTYGKENAIKWWVYWRIFFMAFIGGCY